MKVKTYISILALLLGATSSIAQTYSKMPEAERNALLKKEAIKLYESPHFYKYTIGHPIEGEPTISSYVVTEMPAEKLWGDGDVRGIVYAVALPNFHPKYKRYYDYGKVYFSDKLGKIWSIQFGKKAIYDIFHFPDVFK